MAVIAIASVVGIVKRFARLIHYLKRYFVIQHPMMLKKACAWEYWIVRVVVHALMCAHQKLIWHQHLVT